MSAIAGLCRFRDPAPVKADLERQARALRDHGRDGGGTWHREGAGLAQCLQRFTPEDLFERQPLKSADGHRVLVADARIDNREALADAFGWSPAEARLRPDSAFLLHAYETWGEACPAELLGSFAFAVWDTRRRSLFAAVDPLGTRQLYYHRAPGRFAFATTPAGLFALPEVPRELDPAGLAQRLVLSGAGFDTTVFRGIERLPGGHRMRVTEAGVERVRYWRLDPHREIRLPSDDAYLQAFEEQFSAAVARTLRSTGPIGIAMSGGLDSCSVAHVAAHLLHAKGQRLTSFTNVPRAGWRGPVRRGRYADERPRVELLRRSLPNLECEFVSLDEANGEGAVDRSFAFGGQPPRNPCNLQWLDLIDERAAARGIRVLLSGGLGNATTGWDGRAGLHDRFRALRWRSLWHEIRALGGDSLRRRARLLVGAAMPHLEQCVELYRHGQLNRHPWRVHSSLRPGAEDSLGLRAQWRSSGFHPSSLQPGTGRGSRIHAIESIVANDLLVHDTVARAASGVDHRDPTGDVRLLEFCLALPPEQYLEGGVERRLIRRAMTGKLPDAIVWGKGRGEQAADWFDDVRAAEDRIREDLERFEQLPLARSLLDLPRMRALAEALPDPSRAADREVFQSYRLLLQRGVTMGRYIRWFEGENA